MKNETEDEIRKLKLKRAVRAKQTPESIWQLFILSILIGIIVLLIKAWMFMMAMEILFESGVIPSATSYWESILVTIFLVFTFTNNTTNYRKDD